MGCATGSSRATSRSRRARLGRLPGPLRLGHPPALDAGLLCVFVLLAGLPGPTTPPDRHRPIPRPPRRSRGGCRRAGIGAEPTVSGSWPVALRAVRAWLTPWSVLTRCWRSWSPAPPPRQLQRLLDALAGGQPLHLYLPP